MTGLWRGCLPASCNFQGRRCSRLDSHEQSPWLSAKPRATLRRCRTVWRVACGCAAPEAGLRCRSVLGFFHARAMAGLYPSVFVWGTCRFAPTVSRASRRLCLWLVGLSATAAAAVAAHGAERGIPHSAAGDYGPPPPPGCRGGDGCSRGRGRVGRRRCAPSAPAAQRLATAGVRRSYSAV